jgi:hypothetical protein
MICCRPSRRELLRFGAIVMGASVVPVIDSERAYASAAQPVNLELVTLTETGAILTWYTGEPGTDDGLGRMKPAPADGEIVYGTHPRRLDRTVPGTAGTPYHYVELTGLEPGRTYYYQARSRGKTATPTPVAGAAGTPLAGDTFSFTTPQPPPGRFLFSLALCNDLHLGETVAGLVGGLPFKGISQAPDRPPYPEIMTKALVTDARHRGARYLLAAGDISSEAAPGDVGRAKALLDGFGGYRTDYFVARGNHDRAHDGTAYAACGTGQWQGNDCFRDAFFDGRTYFTHDLHGLHIVGLDTYDKPGGAATRAGCPTSRWPGSRRTCGRTRISRHWCSGTTRCCHSTIPSPRAAARHSPSGRFCRSWRRTSRRPGCSCTMPGIRTATSARSCLACLAGS